MISVTLLFLSLNNGGAFAQTDQQDIEWKTFENSEYGFTIDYPEMMGEPNTYLDIDWSSDIPSIRDLPQMINFFNPNSEENPLFTYLDAELRIYANHEDKSSADFILEDFLPSKLERQSGLPEVKTVNGITGVELETTSTTVPNENRYFVINYNNLVYIFGVENVDYENGNLLYDEMLNSLTLG